MKALHTFGWRMHENTVQLATNNVIMTVHLRLSVWDNDWGSKACPLVDTNTVTGERMVTYACGIHHLEHVHTAP